jgi:hypothetical protein
VTLAAVLPSWKRDFSSLQVDVTFLQEISEGGIMTKSEQAVFKFIVVEILENIV